MPECQRDFIIKNTLSGLIKDVKQLAEQEATNLSKLLIYHIHHSGTMYALRQCPKPYLICATLEVCLLIKEAMTRDDYDRAISFTSRKTKM